MKKQQEQALLGAWFCFCFLFFFFLFPPGLIRHWSVSRGNNPVDTVILRILSWTTVLMPTFISGPVNSVIWGNYPSRQNKCCLICCMKVLLNKSYVHGAKKINKKLCLEGQTYCTELQITWSTLCNSEDAYLPGCAKEHCFIYTYIHTVAVVLYTDIRVHICMNTNMIFMHRHILSFSTIKTLPKKVHVSVNAHSTHRSELFKLNSFNDHVSDC